MPVGSGYDEMPSRQLERKESTMRTLWMVTAALMMGAGSAPTAPLERPPSLLEAVGSRALVDTAVMDAVDVSALLAEDEVRDRTPRGGPARFAAAIDAALGSRERGTWERLDRGWHLWRLRISSPGALSLNLGIARLELPPGARLWVHDGVGDLVHGPYTAADRTSRGELWTPMVLGDTLVLEVESPTRDGVEVEIGSVNHGYRFFGERRGAAKQGACNIDVVCPEGDPWRDQIRAVGWYTLEGFETCSGTLVNNVSEDLTPYFLTADHCDIDETNDETMVVYWNYESEVCGDLSGGQVTDTTRGATLRATWFDSDFALVELSERPDPAYNVHYAGWDATGAVAQGSVCIHHPSTDEKAISFNDDPLTTIWDTHWLVDNWDQGTTEPGSSGSCLFDPDSGLCIGTLTGGTASCSLPDDPDWFGKLSLGFPGGGQPSDSLAPWLDPQGTGTLTLAGRDPVAPSECMSDADTLCLNGGRFKVEVGWRDFQGGTGVGRVVQESGDSGLLWFFQQDNWEMLVKVLDGCGLNQSYWVFAASATDVEYTITVTDTDSGQVRTYSNPLGTQAPAITDTSAFATCP
jgi:hypothetical protein